MKWFYNMKISVKLLTGFFMVAFIAGVVGVIGITNIRSIDQKFSQLFEQYGVALGEIGEISTNFHISRNLMSQEIIENGAANTEEAIKLRDKEIDAGLAAFALSIQTPEEQAEFDALKNLLVQYRSVRGSIIFLAQSDQTEQAIKKMNDTLPTVETAEQAITKIVNDKKTFGRQLSAEYSAQTAKTVATMIFFVLISMLLAIGLGIFISRTINNPVKGLVAIAKKVSEGDLNVDITVETKDEIGVLQEAFKKLVDNNNQVMTNIKAASEQVATGSKQVSESSVVLSQGATEQASSVEELTASLEEISAQTKINADNASQANTIAETARSNAENGNNQMKEMQKAMEEINNASGNISKIIKVIDEIAFQTNILALNAAVEAARAGQQGKGFAVVAEEVRNLAARSANAAKETTGMIEDSIKKVAGGTQIANQTAEALNEIVEDIAKVSNFVSNIAIASNEQAAGIAQINQGILQVSQVIQSNSATSEESAAASEELSSQAELLKEQVSQFKLKKSNPADSYGESRNIEMDIHQIIETINHKNKAVSAKKGDAEAKTAKPKKIEMNDMEFGKY